MLPHRSTSRDLRPPIVIGIGNPLMGDDGIGIELVNRLMKRADEFPGVDFMDAGSSVYRVLHALEGRAKAILLDCAMMGLEPGALRRFTRRDAISRRMNSRLTFHGMDLMHMLELSERMGELPETTIIFAVQPRFVAPGIGISQVLADQLQGYLERIVQDLNEV